MGDSSSNGCNNAWQQMVLVAAGVLIELAAMKAATMSVKGSSGDGGQQWGAVMHLCNNRTIEEMETKKHDIPKEIYGGKNVWVCELNTRKYHMGEKASTMQEILKNPCGLLFLTHRSRPPG